MISHVLQHRGFTAVSGPMGEITALYKCMLQAFYRAVASNAELCQDSQIAPMALKPRSSICYTSVQCLDVVQSVFLADVQQQLGASVPCMPTSSVLPVS